MSVYREFEVLPGEDLSFVCAHLFKDIHGYMQRTGKRCVVQGLVTTPTGKEIAHLRSPDTLRIVYAEPGAFDDMALDGRIVDVVRAKPEQPTPEGASFIQVARYRLDTGSIKRKIAQIQKHTPHADAADIAKHYRKKARVLDDVIQAERESSGGAGRYYVTYFGTNRKRLLLEFAVTPSDVNEFSVAGAEQTMGAGTAPWF